MKLRILCALLVALPFAGCGYHTGLVAPEGTQTIGVEFFSNDGPLRIVQWTTGGVAPKRNHPNAVAAGRGT